jgi:glucoamylase
MEDPDPFAPGWPGIPPRWTSSAKSGIGTAVSRDSRVWFTLSHGVLNEIYYPRVDQACTRDLGFIVTDGASYFSEEKRHSHSDTSQIAAGIPAYQVRNTSVDGRYRIEKEIVTDPWRDVVLQRIRFVPAQQGSRPLRLFVLLAPHLGNHGEGNTAWVGDYKGTPLLLASRASHALALASSAPWRARSAGFVGASDGWQQLKAQGRLTRSYTRAENGNVALIGEIDVAACNGTFVLALGFGPTAMEAGQHALISLLEDFDGTQTEYVRAWRCWHAKLEAGARPQRRQLLYHSSAAVLRTHESKRVEGGVIASLSIPWGFARQDDDLGGYHLVWPRDLVETAGGFIAIGAHEHVRRILRYLQVTQEADGHWSQNMWLDGTTYWQGLQLDETALPILLVDLAARNGVLDAAARDAYWPMVRAAATFLTRHGPASPQDRWEETPGYAAFTIASEIAALLVAAEMAERLGKAIAARYLRETADAWNAGIERWLYISGGPVARRHNVAGYYAHVATTESTAVQAPPVVGLDALALVRFGLRAANDPRILNTLKIVDDTLRRETPHGPVWRRYEGDRYGEHADGRPFDGEGIGRAWPLLTGERGHYELAAGRTEAASSLAAVLEAIAGEHGLIPEQVWDGPDIPARELFAGGPAGSAMPLVWAHSEYLKLCRSLDDGAVFDQPPQTVRRYLIEKVSSTRISWRFNSQLHALPAGSSLRVETLAPAVVHWTTNDWRNAHQTTTVDTTLGTHVADLETESMAPGEQLELTFFWSEAGRWEGTNFTVAIG